MRTVLCFVILFLLLPGAQAKPPGSVDNTQCISVTIPEFNLLPDSFCSISYSKLISKIPDQSLLYDLDAPAEENCFTIVTDVTFNESGQLIGFDFNVPATVTDASGTETKAITISGTAGLTENAYREIPLSIAAYSFTAISIITISDEYGQLGSLITRDAGTLFFGESEAEHTAAAQLSLVKGDGVFSGSTGYISELGQEFNYGNPATATGTFCGPGLADSLFE